MKIERARLRVGIAAALAAAIAIASVLTAGAARVHLEAKHIGGVSYEDAVPAPVNPADDLDSGGEVV